MATPIIPQKRCSSCQEYYPLTEFYKDSHKKDGLNSQCKGCRKVVRRSSYSNNRETELARMAVWQAQNPDKVRQNNRNSYHRHKARINEASRERYANDPEYQLKTNEKNKKSSAKRKEKQRQYHYEWRQRNREHVNAYSRKQTKKGLRREHTRRCKAVRRATERLLTNDLTSMQWETCLEHWNHSCAVCGRPVGLWHTLAMDHWIALADPDCPGTTVTNILPLCHGTEGCNNSKSNLKANQWLVRKFGKVKAVKISKRIEEYFNSLKGDQ